jgi:7-carboxy-7-deazaguanine synthase
MDVKCPSSGQKSNLGLLKALRLKDSVKFVVKDETDCQYALEIINFYRISGEIFISPVFGSDYKMIAKFILDNNLPVRFQIQLHKIAGVK